MSGDVVKLAHGILILVGLFQWPWAQSESTVLAPVISAVKRQHPTRAGATNTVTSFGSLETQLLPSFSGDAYLKLEASPMRLPCLLSHSDRI